MPAAGRAADNPPTKTTAELGGSGHGNLGGVEAVPVAAHGRPFSLSLTVPPLGAVWLRK